MKRVRTSRKQRPPKQPASAEFEVTIETLGGEGDGLARLDGRRIVVPNALPGEHHRVRAQGDARGTVLAESVTCLDQRPRATPICPHFGSCGGCVAQHLPANVETAWKLDMVRRALRRRGLEPDVVSAHQSPPASRRRLRLAIDHGGGRARIGFRARRSREVVEIATCPIATAPLEQAIVALGELVATLETRPAEVALTDYAEGVELVLRGAAEPMLADRERLSAWAEAHDLARLGWRSGGVVEPVVVRREPVLHWPKLSVAPPLEAFLQATAAGEAFLQERVTDAVAGAARACDLYAGIGTLSAAALAAGTRVQAVEQNSEAVDALAGAGLDAEQRDLDRRPLQPAELASFDVVILDPPRRGAEAQVAALAASAVPRVVYVSCSPVTFARDAAVLVAAGLDLTRVDVVDQFRFSAEVELIGAFRREKGP